MVSVIIPYYNRPLKVKRAVNSVLNQTFKQIEIIIVDDSSPVPPPFETNGQIKIIKNEVNSGPGISRNMGMAEAKGDFIAFLDSDDYWDPVFLEKTLNIFDESKDDLVMVYVNTLAIDSKGTKPKRDGKVDTSVILPYILTDVRPWATSSCLWRADLIKDIKWGTNRNWEDYVFDVRAAMVNNHVAHIDEFLVYYDLEGNQKLSQTDFFQRSIEKAKSVIQIYEVLKGTDYIKDVEIKKVISELLIFILEVMKKFENNYHNLDKEVLHSLKELVQSPLYHVIKFNYLFVNNKVGLRIINKLKKLL
ncbi:MAG: glycosyltransferase family 2 protein [Bacteroidetes bacterium]|nr:glycosyltransferase family 2 protein [Bacteroidota bacterium]